MDPEDLAKSTDRAPEPEIVTAGYNDDTKTQVRKAFIPHTEPVDNKLFPLQETFLFNVAAKYGDNTEASTTNVESRPEVLRWKIYLFICKINSIRADHKKLNKFNYIIPTAHQ